MEKFLKVIRTIAILLIVILLSVISFFGIYMGENGIWENILPEYEVGMDFAGYRELRFVLDDTEESKEIYVDENGNYKGDVLISLNGEETENAQEAELDIVNGYSKKQVVEKVNPDEKINIETFEAAKKIIQERIEAQGTYEYNIRQDSITGELIVEVKDDENVDLIEALVTSLGEISIIDSETGIILLDNSYIKYAGVLTSALSEEEIEVEGEEAEEEEHEHNHDETYHQAYLQLDFNEEGTKLIKEISSNYLATTDENATKMVSIRFDDQSLITTYFGEPLETGSIQIPLGDPMLPGEEFSDILYRINRIAQIINSEELPLVYELASDNYVASKVTEETETIFNITFAIIIAAISVYMIIKYKINGLKQAIISIGYIGILLLAIRYTKVIFTYNSVVAFFAVVLINYVFSFKVLNRLKEEKNRKIVLKETMKELYLAIVPVCIIACIFTFMYSTLISSMGNALFWGLLVQAVMSLLVLI